MSDRNQTASAPHRVGGTYQPDTRVRAVREHDAGLRTNGARAFAHRPATGQ